MVRSQLQFTGPGEPYENGLAVGVDVQLRSAPSLAVIEGDAVCDIVCTWLEAVRHLTGQAFKGWHPTICKEHAAVAPEAALDPEQKNAAARIDPERLGLRRERLLALGEPCLEVLEAADLRQVLLG